MKRILTAVVVYSFCLSAVMAQQQVRVFFKDKGKTAIEQLNPYDILSPQAVAKRAARQIPIQYSDLPVSKSYLEELRSKGAQVKMHSRWFNFALVETEDPSALSELAFVKKIEYRDPGYRAVLSEKLSGTANINYGVTARQVEMLNGDYLHDLGYLGQGMTIAVLDAGFDGAPNIPGLDSLLNSSRLLGTYDFVAGDSNVYNGNGNHGTAVLTTMAGYVQDTFIGTAVKANYYLFSTEDVSSETPAEMENWLAAAEKADSLGVDVITSSLGYNKFDGGVGDYDYDDMDGNTTLITKAADMAATKGMLVVVSAGNEGSSPWGKITAPADGDSVLSIGAVDFNEGLASFSSRGPTFDGRIKPDVLAQGQGTAILTPAGATGANGTSFACPLIAGMAACLWQSQAQLSGADIYDAIKFEAENRFSPNNDRGFGLANFKNSSWAISLKEEALSDRFFRIYPNPVQDRFTVELISPELSGVTEVKYQIISLDGKLAQAGRQRITDGGFELEAPDAPGTYILMVEANGVAYLTRLMK